MALLVVGSVAGVPVVTPDVVSAAPLDPAVLASLAVTTSSSPQAAVIVRAVRSTPRWEAEGHRELGI